MELTAEMLRESPEEEYMNDDQTEFFRNVLLKERQTLLDYLEESKVDDIDPASFADPVDRATYEEERTLINGQRSRATQRLIRIAGALGRINDGDYGYCTSSGEPIGVARLLIEPVAELSLDEQTRREHQNRWGPRS